MSASSPNELLKFIEGFRTIVLATVSVDGLPHASYAPFVWQDSSVYIFVSGLAAHTRHLLDTGQCHVMLLRDESSTTNMFARHRLSWSCSAAAVPREEEAFREVLGHFRQEFGPVIDMLQSLPDFVLFRLDAIGEANWVTGFGKATSVPLP